VAEVGVEKAVGRIRSWGERCDWRGYDPYDALNSPLAPFLTLGTRRGRRLLTQVVKLSPLNLRPLLGIRREWNAKAIGLVAGAYGRLAAAGDDTAHASADRWLDWLVANHAGEPEGLAWGYHFDVQTRFFAYARNTPNTIATSFCGHAFLDAAELAGDASRKEQAVGVARFLTESMLFADPGGAFFRYLPEENELVHNANLLACSLLARTASVTGDDALFEPARPALETTLAAQSSDGSWPYAAGASGQWVDNFHTGYVLESLAWCLPFHSPVRPALERGIAFWDSELFLADGTPKYSTASTYPLDAHCYATAIDTWLALADWYPEALSRAERLAHLLIERMLDRTGFVHFQTRRAWTSRVPFVRWTTAPSFRALAGLLLRRTHEAAPTRVGEASHSRLD
jgi:hypothetical protein